MFFKKKKQYDEGTLKRFNRWKSLNVSEKFVKKATELENQFTIDRTTIITKSSKALEQAESVAFRLVELIPDKKAKQNPEDVKEILLDAYDYIAESHQMAFESYRRTLEKFLDKDIR